MLDASPNCCPRSASVSLKASYVIAFGQTHKPWHREVEGIHFVNTGSVGRPEDGNPHACYARVYFADSGVVVEHVRVPYDVEATIAGVRTAGLPDDFVEFLRTGGAPAPGAASA